MALFTISDPHLSFTCDKPMDVFGGKWNNYTKKLEEYWRYMVDDGDTVILPGDISWGMNFTEAAADLNFLHQLPGHKIILKGNHDYWWATANKLEQFKQEYQLSTIDFLHNNAFVAEDKIICGTRGWACEDKMSEEDQKILAREALRFQLSVDMAKELREKSFAEDGIQRELLAFFHYPILTLTARENPILPILKAEGITRVFYGHLHNVSNLTLPTQMDGISYTLVSCDHIDFTPMRIL